MSVVDVIYQRMKDDTEAVFESKGESEITKFYGGLNILLTGPTNLLGKCLLEKLLRECPDVKRIYVLIKVKKCEEFVTKYTKLFTDNVFDELRKLQPNFKEKITPINGDLSVDRLGLSDADYASVSENVELIFHNGAATGLSEQVSVALAANVLGTKRMLELARDCKHLKGFLLVSSAYSHCPERVIEEKFYRSPADLKTVEDMMAADLAPSGLTDDSLRMLLGDWPNIFVFSKAVAEELVQRHAVRAPYACCVFRPSAVISSYQEPQPGWVDAKNGPAQLFLKMAMGAVHVLYKHDYPLDLVPADLAVNAMLVCAWDAVDRWQVEPEAFVYNFGSSQEKPINLGQIKDKLMEDPVALRTSRSKRVPYIIFASNYLAYFALRIIIDYIPALIIDALSIVHNSPPEQTKLVVESMGDMCRLQRFSRGNWRVRMSETLKAIEKMNQRDRELFSCDIRQLNWDDYFLTFWRGIRLNVLRDSLEGAGAMTSGRRCCKCHCKCPCDSNCPVISYGSMFIFGYLIYYLIVLFLF